MKKLIKFCTVAGLVLLLIGLGITTVSAALGGRFRHSFPYRHFTSFWRHHSLLDDRWDRWTDYDGWYDGDRWYDYEDLDDGLNYSSTQDGADANPTVFSEARRLDVDIEKGAVRIYQKQDIEGVTVYVLDSYKKTNSYMDGETLKIKSKSPHGSVDNPLIQIAVPSGYHFDKLSLDVGAAQCEINGIDASKLDIDAGVGDIVFTGSVTGDVDLDTGVGTVTLNLAGSEQDYNYKVDCGVGTVRIGGSEYNIMSPDKHIDNQAQYNMDLDCGVGDVTINFDQTV